MTIGPGRNQLCLCGSGKKTKSCCGRGVPGFGATVTRPTKERRSEPFIFVAIPTRGAIAIETHTALTSNIGLDNVGFITVARRPIVEARNKLAAEIAYAVSADVADLREPGARDAAQIRCGERRYIGVDGAFVDRARNRG